MAKGTIDQLNFEVLLHDEKFAARVQKDIDLAKKLNTSLTEILTVRKNINSTYAAAATGAKQEAKAAEQTAKAHARAQAAIEKSAKTMGGSGNSLLRGWLRFSATLWSIIGIVRILANAIGSFVKKIAEFQQANANLATIMQVSRREIKTLTEDALMLGRTTEWTASQVTELQTALAKLGYNIPQIRNMQASVLQFATAVGANLPDAANLAGASLRMFGMHSTEMQKTLEILTASTNKTALDFEKLKVALPYVGAIAHSIGFDVADTSALLGVLANSGLAASRSGTGLRKVLLELSKENGKLQTAMGGGIKTFDDFVNGLQALRDRGLEAGEAQKLVGDRAGAALLILANGVDDIRRLNKEVRDTDGLLKDIQAERLDTLHGSTLLLKSAWEGLIQTFRDSAGPMKDIVDWLTKIVRWTSLAASRANRIAQGTKNGFWGGWASRPGLWAKGITGSDDLTKEFTEMYDRLIEQKYSPQEAARLVNEQMRERERRLRKEFGLKEGEEPKNLYESWWFRRLSRNVFTGGFTNLFTQGTQARSEQMEAMGNTFDAVGDYMATHAKEAAEIAANEYLEEWRLVFDTQGKEAAYAAMNAVTGYEDIKNQVIAYIDAGGEEGASVRGAAKSNAEAEAEREHRERIERLKNEAAQLKKLADAYEQLEPYLGKETEAKMVELFGPGDYSKQSLEEQIRSIAAALRELGEDGAKVADGIENTWGLDDLSVTLKRLKVLEDARKLAEDAKKMLWSYKAEPGLAKKPQGKTDEEEQYDEKKMRALARQAKYIANEFVKIADAIKEFGDASLNGGLADLGEKIGEIASIAESAAAGFRSGGPWGAVIGGITSVITQVLGGLTEVEQKAKEIRDAIIDARVAASGENFKSFLADGTDGIFGSNTIKGIRNAVDGLAAVEKKMKDLDDWIVKFREDAEKYMMSGGMLYSMLPEGKENTLIRTLSSRWGAKEEYATIEQLAQVFGRNLWDENGNLNPALLKDILDTYGDLNEELTEWLKNGIEYANEYAEAMKQIEDAAKELVGDVVSDAADKIVDSWWEAGRAALDYADILEDVAKGYAKLIVQDMLMSAAFDENRKQAFINALKSGDAETAMATVAGAMQAAQDMLPTIEQALQVFEPYRNMNGSSGGSSGLSSGIKGITEETAGLLASYINAIRADVSYIRMMQERGWEHINAFGAALPTLNDHIAQIAATNFDIAQSNQSILSELRSVIGPVGTSGMVVRVENA